MIRQDSILLKVQDKDQPSESPIPKSPVTNKKSTSKRPLSAPPSMKKKAMTASKKAATIVIKEKVLY
jgi:hypothetical protein